MTISMMERTFTPDWPDRDAAIAAYERHNQHVRDTVAGREASSSGAPGMAGSRSARRSRSTIPAEPFPHTNTRAQFREHSGLE